MPITNYNQDIQSNNTKENIMASVTKQVTVTEMTAFDRINTHTPREIVEKFVAVWMEDESGERLVTFNREDREFVNSVAIGDTFVVSGNVKEFRDDEHGPRTVLTFCKRGGYAAASQAEKKEAKKIARLKKLGLI